MKRICTSMAYTGILEGIFVRMQFHKEILKLSLWKYKT